MNIRPFENEDLEATAEVPKEVCGQIFVAPPLALLPFEPGINLPLLKLIITGEEDGIAPPEVIRESLAGWNRNVRFEIIDFADHFYFGSFKALEKLVERFISQHLQCLTL